MYKTQVSLILSLLLMIALSSCGSSETSSSSEAQAPPSVPQSTSAPPPSSAPPSSSIAPVELVNVNFNLINDGALDLAEIRMNPSSETEWGDNLLTGEEVLPRESVVPVDANEMAEAGALFNIQTVDTDGNVYEYYDIPITEISELRLQDEQVAWTPLEGASDTPTSDASVAVSSEVAISSASVASVPSASEKI